MKFNHYGNPMALLRRRPVAGSAGKGYVVARTLRYAAPALTSVRCARPWTSWMCISKGPHDPRLN